MKRYLKRILVFILAISISFSCLPLTVHATHGGGGTSDKDQDSMTNFVGKLDWDKMSTSRKWVTIIEYVTAQTEAVANGDFTQYLQSQEAFKEYVYGKEPDDFVTDEGMTIPKDLVALIKQALIEYANETNGFWTMPTTRVTEIDATQFTYKAEYDTLRFLTRDTGLIAVNGPFIADLTPLYEEGWAFVNTSTSYDPSSLQTCWTRLYDSQWQLKNPYFYSFKFDDTVESGYTSFEQGKYGNETGMMYYWFSYFSPNYPRFNGGKIYYQVTDRYKIDHSCLISNDGRRIRVFKSLDAYKFYSVEQRSVYFGKGFYDFDPKEITATWDDISKTINHIDDILQQLLDKIDENTDESKIEELLQQILDALLNGGGSGDDQGGGSGSGGGSYDDSGLLAALSGGFSSILSALSGIGGILSEGFYTLSGKLDAMIYELGLIYQSIGDMTEAEVNEKTDSLLSTLFSAFSEIVDVLKCKFPFSLPWDFYTLLSLLAGNDVSVQSDTGTVVVSAYGYSDGFYVTALSDAGGEIQPYGNDWTRAADNDSDAPRFEIPFVIASAGIDETLEIDLSPFDSVSKLSRTLLSLLYCFCLIKLTFKVLSLGRELSND